AIALTIQVNTSLSTTPILLARDKDLPKAQQELGPFVSDPTLREEVRTGLEKLVQLLDTSAFRHVDAAYRDLDRRLGEAVFSRTVVKSSAHRFAQACQQAERARQEFDLPTLRTRLEEARGYWQAACERVDELNNELARRLESCTLFLRWIASGQ